MSKHANKRSAAQIAADRRFIAHHASRGKTQEHIADMLALERPYTLTRQQVQKDCAIIERQWARESIDLRYLAKARILKSLDAQEAELWDAWDKSKADSVRQSVERIGKSPALETIDGETPPAGRVRIITVKESRCGDASFMRTLLDVHERRAKLLGLDAPTKRELSGPDGIPIELETTARTFESPISPEEKDELILRHYERILRAKAAVAGKTAGSAPPVN